MLLLQPGSAQLQRTARDRWDIEVFVCLLLIQENGNQHPADVLILMTRRGGVRRFSTNSNYNIEQLSQFVCVTAAYTVQQKTKDSCSGHVQAHFVGVFPSMERRAGSSPDPDSSHSVQPKIPVFPSQRPTPSSSHSLSGEVDFFFCFPNNDYSIFFHCCPLSSIDGTAGIWVWLKFLQWNVWCWNRNGWFWSVCSFVAFLWWFAWLEGENRANLRNWKVLLDMIFFYLKV